MTWWAGVLLAVAVLTAAAVVGLLLRRRDGRFGPVTSRQVDVDPVLHSLGVRAGTTTLLQFSSAFCAPCRTTRVLCADVAAKVPDVQHIEVDAESHLDAVRALDIWRTPTVLIIDCDATVRSRASGAPTRSQLVAAVAELLPRSDVVASRSSE